MQSIRGERGTSRSACTIHMYTYVYIQSVAVALRRQTAKHKSQLTSHDDNGGGDDDDVWWLIATTTSKRRDGFQRTAVSSSFTQACNFAIETVAIEAVERFFVSATSVVHHECDLLLLIFRIMVTVWQYISCELYPQILYYL